MKPILELQNLEVNFHTLDGVVHAVNDVSYAVESGKTLGLVGESGCGKSVSVLSILRLIQEPPGKIKHGKILYQGEDLLEYDDIQMEKIRGAEIGIVFQDPMTYLNPVLTIGKQISEAIVVHKGLSYPEADEIAIELLNLVGIPNPAERLKDYPHQFSGGMRQRVMIAIALSCSPNVLIADEPTTALDVTIQAQIVDLVRGLQDDLGTAVLWITHDLGVIAELADRVAVMYAGYVVEEADVYTLYGSPQHPYTNFLLNSLPRVDNTRRSERLATIPGFPPDGITIMPGCPLQPRCKFAVERCSHENPPLRSVNDGHRIACWVDIGTGREL
jgi:oligopeptide transport system ATP-binding protein